MCLFELWFSQGVCPVVELLGHMVVLGLPGGSVVKNLLATARDTENAGLILSWEDPLEEEMATPPVFLPQKSHGQRSLAAYSPWDHKESDTTE